MACEWFLGFLRRYYLVDGYNVVNTLTYGLLLGASVYGVVYLVRKLEIRFDRKLAIALTPFVFYGGSARDLVDQKLGWYGTLGPYPENYFFVAPGIYLTMFVLTFVVIAISVLLFRKGFHIPAFAMGSILAAYNLRYILSAAVNYKYFGLILVSAGAGSLAAYVLLAKLLPDILREGNMFVVFAHLFDAAATFVGVDHMGFSEKHVLPTYLIEKTGTALVMFPLKLLVVIPALYVIDGELRDDELSRRLVKFVVLVLGAGPAIRDASLVLLTSLT
jgi:uncharacterized membrane protein